MRNKTKGCFDYITKRDMLQVVSSTGQQHPTLFILTHLYLILNT